MIYDGNPAIMERSEKLTQVTEHNIDSQHPTKNRNTIRKKPNRTTLYELWIQTGGELQGGDEVGAGDEE